MHFIRAYDNAFSEEFCDELNEAMDECIKVGSVNVRNDIYRKDNQMEFNDPVRSYEVDFRDSGKAEKFFSVLNQYVDQYMRDTSIEGIIRPVYFKNMLVQRNVADDFDAYSAWHAEINDLGNCDRALTYVLYLDDEAGNNGTEFRYQKHIEPAKKGKLVIFPAGFTHVHRGTMLTSGEKTIATGWCFYTIQN